MSDVPIEELEELDEFMRELDLQMALSDDEYDGRVVMKARFELEAIIEEYKE